ncbi:MAG TPA: V-type ATP synthase subunit I [Methanoculleus sp.]|nr:V-type ATP synthase subunit I [Methanoculleus sp.]
MFKVQTMSRLLIAASKDQLDTIVRELYRHNLFHIEDFVESDEEEYEGYKIGMPLPGAGEVSSDLIRIRSIESSFGVSAGEVEISVRSGTAELTRKIESEFPLIEKEAMALIEEKNSLENTVREYGAKLAELKPFAGYTGNLEDLKGFEFFRVFAGHVSAEVGFNVPNESFYTTVNKKQFLIAVVPLENAGEAEHSLLDAGFQAVAIPDETGTAHARIEWYTQEIARLNNEIEAVKGRILAQKEKHAAFLVACDELLTAEVERKEAPLRFATTEETFVAEGWVPVEKKGALISDITSATGGKVYITELEYDPVNDVVPIEYNNPDFSKPTEALMDIYSRPQYSEFDPTLLVAIVFPIFFGFILGDVGYGLILLALSIYLRKMLKGEAGQKLLDVLRNASVSSIIFGVIFSEFLGFALPWDPIGINRHLNIGGHAASGHGPDVVLMLILSAWIGIVHLTLGRFLHMYNAMKRHHPGKHRTQAVMGQAGWILTMWGILFALWSFFALPIMPDLTGFPALVAGLNIFGILGAVMIIIGVVSIAQENVLELLELPTIISHVLSYARLAAVGLSSVAIAMVVNYMAIESLIQPQLESFSVVGIVFILLGIVVFLAGHILNTALGILGGGLHSIRLHYVEFFTKFYQGGGKKYQPFGKKRKFTED